MVLAIPTTQPGIEGQVGHLENSPFLLLVDLDLIDLEETSNPLTAADDPDRELALMLRLVKEDVQIVLVDRCDSKTPDCLRRAGIQIMEGMQGDALDALEQFRQYCLDETQVMSAIHPEN